MSLAKQERKPATSEWLLLKTGAVCAVAGAVLALVSNVLHPHPTDPGAMLRETAASDGWAVIHLGIILSAMLILGGLVALDRSLAEEPGAALTRLGLAAGLVGTTVLVVGISIDGFAGKALADAWTVALASEEAAALRMVQAVELVHTGLFIAWIFLLFGVTFLLYGLAVALSYMYPRWLGWVAVLGGAGSTIVGMIMFLSGGPASVTETFFLGFSMVFIFWVLIMGVLMWRGASNSWPEENAPGEPRW